MDPSTRELVLQTIRDISSDMYKQKAPPDKICPGIPGSDCPGRQIAFRCVDCFAPEHLCGLCLHHAHIHNPFHRFEMWIGGEWQPLSLKNTGFNVQLGHPAGDLCPAPSIDHLFHVVDTTGVHEACIYYCGCERSVGLTRGDQLMNHRLYPDHPTAPRTAVAYQLAYTVVNALAPTVSTPRPPQYLIHRSPEQQHAWDLRPGKLPIDFILLYFFCRYLCLPHPAPMSSSKKRKGSESVDLPPATRPCGEDLRESAVADNEPMGERWNASMEGLRDFYNLDNPNYDRIDGGIFCESAPRACRTDGEGIEGGWALLSSLAVSTKTMGRGARHDPLEDDFANLHRRFTTTKALLRPFENRPYTIAEREVLARTSAPTRKRTGDKVKLFPLDAEKDIAKVEEVEERLELVEELEEIDVN
ncbi:hypothetical protein C8R47DRAFT_1205386 [Mycena vitilis]|nr:hypothetical protein C8R47DRAFT_1205386 [Mycena vitilis]